MSLLYVIEVILAVGFVVFIHELGHFLAAKKIGVKVEVFSLGFGPAIFKFTKGDTLYQLCALPLGGFVKMAGETTDDSKGGSDEFLAQPIKSRALVFIAGVVMNVVGAIICFIVAFQLGVNFQPAEVGYVVAGDPADIGGIKLGDRIISIDDKDCNDFQDVLYNVALSEPDKELVITVERDGEIHNLSVIPEFDDSIGAPSIGISSPSNIVVGANPGSIGELMDLEPGDRVIGVNGTSVGSHSGILDALENEASRQITFTIERNSETLNIGPFERIETGMTLFERVQVKKVSWQKPAYYAGFKENDIITAVDGEEIKSIRMLSSMVENRGGEEIAFTVIRSVSEGQQEMIELRATPKAKKGRKARIGVVLGFPDQGFKVDEVKSGSPAYKAGLRKGDLITHFAGRKIQSANEFQTLFLVDVDAKWTRDNTEITGMIPLEKSKIKRVAEVGIILKTEMKRFKYSFGGSLKIGLIKTRQFMGRVLTTFKRIFYNRSMGVESLGGPVAVVVFLYYTATMGVSQLVYFMGLIGVCIAVFNVLPFPVLDGGHLLLLVVEKIRGRRLSENFEKYLMIGGMVLLLSLALFLTYHDIFEKFTRLFGGR